MERRSRGRPRSFDPGQVMRRVAETFRDSGYSATSLDELAAVTGLKRPSLNAAFGSKKAMYLRALTTLRDDIATSADRRAAAGLSLREMIRLLLADSITAYLAGPASPRGCLAVCTASAEAVVDADIRHALDDVLGITDAKLAGWFERTGTTEPLRRARLVSGILHSLSVRARAGQPREVLEEMAEDALIWLVPEPE